MTTTEAEGLREKLKNLERFLYHTADCHATYPEGNSNCCRSRDMQTIVELFQAFHKAEVDGAIKALKGTRHCNDIDVAWCDDCLRTVIENTRKILVEGTSALISEEK